jgi:hypothetical protein
MKPHVHQYISGSLHQPTAWCASVNLQLRIGALDMHRKKVCALMYSTAEIEPHELQLKPLFPWRKVKSPMPARMPYSRNVFLQFVPSTRSHVHRRNHLCSYINYQVNCCRPTTGELPKSDTPIQLSTCPRVYLPYHNLKKTRTKPNPILSIVSPQFIAVHPLP